MPEPTWPWSDWPQRRVTCYGMVFGRKLKIQFPLSSAMAKHLRSRKGYRWINGPFLEVVARKKWKGVYVDIGAGFGLNSLAFAHCCESTTVIACEPWPPSFDVLKVNSLQSGKIKVLNAYFGDRVGDVVGGFGKFLKIARLDSYLEQLSLGPIAFIRIDGSMGGWDAVVRGTVRIIEKHRPALAIEVFTHGEDLRARRWAATSGYHPLGTFNTTPRTILYEPVAKK